MQRSAAPAISVQAILQALRRAQSCDVQEQHTSGVQPELTEHELRRSGVRERSDKAEPQDGSSARQRYNNMPPDKKGSKGMNWEGAYPGSGLPTGTLRK